MSVPTGSPIDIRIILPLVFKLKTIIGSWLSRHMAMEVASMTASDLDRTSRYETSRYITAPGNCKGSLSYTPSTRVALAITSARISRYETSRYITAPGNCKGSLSYTPSTRVALAITSARISRYETSRYITAPGNCKGSLSY